MQLDNRVSELGALYELGNVVAVEYPIDNVPPDEQIEADLLVGASWLGRIYGLGDEGLYVPGNSPEVADSITALAAISRPRGPGDEGLISRVNASGVPVDFVAEAIATIWPTDGYHSYDVMNPYDDAISLDTFVDWLIDAGHSIERVDDYATWLARFETALRALPDRQHSVLPLLSAYAQPEKPIRGAVAPD